ncbi:hypothetical protein [endosymbiont GvMRE of Glomus versiforme]|uniref:hypothetical protein n=1 Tax=endosymbiont GvMRE of Glomus versiforme TaxID=2039283 RepID=UPI0011C48BF8|nr:hypothetical protein [endosymbiont GvMRE of Glomus versiforme]
MESNKRKCGFVDCNNLIEKKEGYAWPVACENCLYSKKATRCDACFKKEDSRFHTIWEFSDEVTGENKVEFFVEATNFDYAKEVIQKFLAHNISTELRQELNSLYQKCLDLEKDISEFKELAREKATKEQGIRKEFIQEKGGSQFNIYEYFLCASCSKELNERERKLREDYDTKLSKFTVFDDEELFDRVATEIGHKAVDKITWTTGTKYTEEEFEENHKKNKESLERILKEAETNNSGNLNLSQLEELRKRVEFYNNWDKPSKVSQEIKENSFQKGQRSENNSSVLPWILGIGGIIILLGTIIYFVYRNKKKLI